jgi:hypothetical protein
VPLLQTPSFGWLIISRTSSRALHRRTLIRKAAFLQNAITRFPADDRFRHELVAHLLNQVEFDQHHLEESKYIGDAHADQEKLMEARRVIRDLSSSSLLAPLDRAQALLGGWLRFLESQERDFPAWCKRNGIDPPDRVTRVYYK